jgi:predicted nucleic acid-binding protein
MKTDGVVADTNIVIYFINDYMKGSNDTSLNKIFIQILNKCGFVVNDQIIFEYKNSIKTLGFQEWLGDQLLSKKIDYIKENDRTKLEKKDKKSIHDTFGLPRNSKDIHFIKCANHTQIKIIISKDIDLYDPKKKNAPPSERYEIMINRSGLLCRYLERNLDIKVGFPEYCHERLYSKGLVGTIN